MTEIIVNVGAALIVSGMLLASAPATPLAPTLVTQR
jgi:hypothetical protein